MEVIDNALTTIRDEDIITGKQLKQIITPISIVLSTLSIRVSVIDHLPVFARATNQQNKNDMKSPLINAIQTITELQDEKVLRKLKEWVRGNKAMVVYDTNNDEWNCEEFNKRIINKKNVSLLIFTEDNDIFGIHYKFPKADVNTNLIDNNHFLFSLSKHGKIRNRMWKSSKEVSCLTLYESGSILFKTPAFSIQSTKGRKGSSVNQYLDDAYPSVKDSTLTKYHYPSFFETKRIVVVEWV